MIGITRDANITKTFSEYDICPKQFKMAPVIGLIEIHCIYLITTVYANMKYQTDSWTFELLLNRSFI